MSAPVITKPAAEFHLAAPGSKAERKSCWTLYGDADLRRSAPRSRTNAWNCAQLSGARNGKRPGISRGAGWPRANTAKPVGQAFVDAHEAAALPRPGRESAPAPDRREPDAVHALGVTQRYRRTGSASNARHSCPYCRDCRVYSILRIAYCIYRSRFRIRQKEDVNARAASQLYFLCFRNSADGISVGASDPGKAGRQPRASPARGKTGHGPAERAPRSR